MKKKKAFIIMLIAAFLMFSSDVYAISYCTLKTENVANYDVGVYNGGGSQGATASYDGKYIFFFVIGSNVDTHLRIYKRNSKGTYDFKKAVSLPADCKHCNDAVYYEENGKKYLIVPRGENTGASFLKYELDLTNYKISSYSKISIATSYTTLAYNTEDKEYYVLKSNSADSPYGKTLYSLNSSFGGKTVLRKLNDGKTNASGSKGLQGALYSYGSISYYNQHIYVISDIWKENCEYLAKGYGLDKTSLCKKNGDALIAVINSKTGDFSKFLYYNSGGELESLFVGGGEIFTISNDFGKVTVRRVTNASSAFTYTTLNAEYHMNGGSLSGSHGSKYSVSGDTILYNGSSSIKIGDAGGLTNLHDYNASSAINITKGGHSAKAGAEWCTNANGGGTCYSQSANLKVSSIADVTEANKTVKLYVNWVPNTYKITYDANGGTGAPSPTSYTYATSGTTTLSSTIPTRSGYIFKGWSTSKTATSATYSAGQAWNKNNANNYTLYAVWENVNYSLTVSEGLIMNEENKVIKVPILKVPITTFKNHISANTTFNVLDKSNAAISGRGYLLTSDVLALGTGSNITNYTILVLGDVNSDALINRQDVSELTRYILTGSGNKKYFLAGDMDNNYNIKMNDTMLLLKKIT